jgi:protein gp37
MREYMMRFHGEWTLDRSISWEEDGRDHLSYGAYAYGPLPNVWAGVSVENQPTADERIPLLLETPAAVRLVSYEPALGAVDFARVPTGRSDCCGGAAPCVDNALSSCSGPRLDWIICGGESGPGARPMHPDWARSVRDQCAAAGVPYFHKQNGAWIHQSQGARWPTYAELIDADADPNMHRWPDGTASFRIGKARAGRLLDGREHNDMPAGAAERKRWDAVLP